MLTDRATLFLIGVAALLPLLAAAVLLWRRFYRDDADPARAVARNSALPIAAGVINKVIDFGFAVIALRFLGPEGNGAYAFVALIAGLYFLTIANWGLNDLLVREAAAEPARTAELFGLTLSLRLVISALLIPVAAALVWLYALIGNPLSPAAVVALALLIVHLFPAALAAACSAAFQAAQRMEVAALVALLTNILKTLVGVAMLVAVPDVAGRVVGLAAVALGATTLNALLFLLLQRRLLFRAPLVWSWPAGRELLREGFPLLLNSLLIAVFFRFDMVVLRAQADDYTVGVYDAAYKIINLTQIIPPYFVAALFPLLARYAAADRAALDRAYRRALSLLQLLAWPVAVGVTLLAPELIRLIGGAAFVADASQALMLLIWYLPLSYANGVGQYVLIALRRQRAITVAFALGAGVNLALNLLLIPRYGFMAAAAATVATEVVLLAALLRALRAAGAAPPLLRLIWRPALAALLMGLAMWPALAVSPYLAAAIAPPAYAAALWALGAIGPDERDLARRIVGHRARG